MSTLLAATEPARTIVIERGGTAWWVPFVTALGVALAAVAGSYYATWRFKKGDVNRENVFKAADLVDEAAQMVSRPSRYADEGGASTTLRLIGQREQNQLTTLISTTASRPLRVSTPIYSCGMRSPVAGGTGLATRSGTFERVSSPTSPHPGLSVASDRRSANSRRWPS
jgi:hypothetical protein